MNTVICYRPNGNDYVKGCLMGTSDSTIDIVQFETLEEVAKYVVEKMHNADKGYEYDEYEFSYVIDNELYEDWPPDFLQPHLSDARKALDTHLKAVAKVERNERRVKRLEKKAKAEAKKELKQSLLAKTLGVG